ncbi:EAL domain-containing protein [Curvibacter sp. HBC61]|uniref:EAL domain-containing protein n=1 Tax=Curvibacter cyanobacteriorum TaxID=3026422 RepID=A0ABT5N0Z6_9BURK|nr:EAL domain-containing protein [Curvibacter sp. HBC61]MDD0838717.1 EAL domain-containing protein [Curvibacter sp. HBC61]
MRHRSGFETQVLAAFAAAMAVVLLLLGATWVLGEQASEATRWVEQTQNVLLRLGGVRAESLQVEISTQNFRLQGEPQHLIERNDAIARRAAQLQALHGLLSDNPAQLSRWQALNAVVEQRLAISLESEQLRKTQGPAAANAYIAQAPLATTRAQALAILQAMEQEEQRLLQARIEVQHQARQRLLAAGLLMAGLLLGLLYTSFGLIRRQLRETQASQRALADSEEDLATTLRSIGDAVLATDPQGRITRLNPVAEQLTGWSAAEALGRRLEDVFRIVHEDTGAPAETPLALVLATGQAQELTGPIVLIPRQGEGRPIADSAAPIRDKQGRVRGVVLVFRDVSADRQAQRQTLAQKRLLEQHVQERTAQLSLSEEHLRNVIGAVPAVIAYVDAQQRFVYTNQPYIDRFAPGQRQITGRTVSEILGPERYPRVAAMIEQALQGQPQSYDWQPFPGVWQAVRYVPKTDASGRVDGYYVLGSDITERKKTEEHIQRLNQELAQRVRELEHVSRALRTLSAGNRTMLRARDEAQLLQRMCQAIVEAGGYPVASVWYRQDDAQQSLQLRAECGFPAGLAEAVSPWLTWADGPYGQGVVAKAVRTGEAHVVTDMPNDPSYQRWRAHLHGFASGLACPLRVDGEVIGALAIFASETHAFDRGEILLLGESADDLAFGIATLRTRRQQQQTQEAMQHLTRHDALTGLPNLTQFTERLTQLLSRPEEEAAPLAILQINIERLSEINDALGFGRGDQMLQEFGQRLRQLAPASALVARLRGDEFALLLPGSQARDALQMVQHLEQAWRQPFALGGIELDVSARTGVALHPDHGHTVHDLLRHVDMALHHAKTKGLQHQVYDPARNPEGAQRLNQAGELRRAIEGGDLRLFLQPKIDMLTGRVCGAEGLVRWQHAERGLIGPGQFIDLAEHTGLIKPLTEWMIQHTLSVNHAWEAQGQALPIAVNLSARNLRDEGLLDTLRSLRQASGVGPGLLELELTESTLMEDAELALRVLHSLRDDGIALYIDDFGTGYSSLAYLQKMPVDCIKIDQSFVGDMIQRKESAAIVRSTIDLVHDLGRKVVAEGVETQAQWDRLRQMGCDQAQGYLMARPMPAADFPAWRAAYEQQHAAPRPLA